MPTGVGVIGWYPDVGLILGVLDVPTNHIALGVATMDGFWEERSSEGFGGNRRFGWWPDGGRMEMIDLGGPEREIDPVLLAYRELEKEPFYDGIWAYQWVRLSDRHIYTTGFGINAVTKKVITTEFTGLPLMASWIGPGRGTGEVFLSGAGPIGSYAWASACFYNTLKREVSSPVMYLSVSPDRLKVTYAPEFGVMISVHDDTTPDRRYLRIWSLEVEPSIVTEAEVIRGEARAGCVPTYRVQVTGAQGEPCPGELVDWTVSGVGRLERSQSKTDDDGYATVKVIYGLDDDGDSIVKASVRC